MSSTGRVALFATLLVGILLSCVKVEEDNQNGSGYLSFLPLSIDVSVNGDSHTKANVPPTDLPAEDEFIVTITGNTLDKDIVLEHNEYLEGPILLPVGTYIVSASYGSNEFDTPYFYKSEKIEIKENVTEQVSISDVSLANAMVKVTLPDMEKHLPDGVLTLSAGTEAISVNAGEYHYVPVKENVPITVSLSGTNTVGQPKTFSSTLEVEAKRAYNVVFDLSLPDLIFADQSAGAIAGRLYLTSLASGAGLDSQKFEYKISSDGGQTWSDVEPVPVQDAKKPCWFISGLTASTYKIKAVYGGMETEPWEFTPSIPSSPVAGFEVKHDYSGDVLTGSTVTVSGADVQYSTMLQELIGERGVKVIYSDETVRTITGKETGSMSAIVNDPWPYLPKGDYTLKAYFKIGNEEVIYDTETYSNTTSPSFTVTTYAETSYSRYNSSDPTLKNKANDAGTGDKVMNIQGKVSISDAILGNSNYSNLIKASLKYDDEELLSSTSVSSNTFEGADQTGQEWRAHPLTASFTFDGFSDNDEMTCDVTGIPYSYNFYNKNVSTLNKAGWTTHNVEYEFQTSSNNKCTIQNDGSNGYLISPKFYAPENISIPLQYSIQAQYYRAWGINVGSKSIQLRVGVTSSTSSVASSYNTYTCKGSNNTGGNYTTYTNTDSSNPQSLSIKANQYISLSHNNANVSGQIDYLCIYGFELKYL